MTKLSSPVRANAPIKRLIALGLTITLGFSSICALVLWESRNRDRDQARLSAINLVASIGSDISRNFEIYDLSLQAVVEGLRLPDVSMLPPRMRQMLLFDRAASAKDMGSIFVLDRYGTVILDSRVERPLPDNYAQSDFFKVHQGVEYGGPYVSTPWRNADGEYLIAISRRLSSAN
ncbi:MAG TPA: hypothetical protein VGC36_01060, partial [Rhizomicrobium sp.]